MRHVRLVASWAAVATVAGSVTGLVGPASASGVRSADGELRTAARSAGAPVTLRRGADGLVHQLRTVAGHPVPRPAGVTAGASPETAARGFLAGYGRLFGIRDEARELRLQRSIPLEGGSHVTRLQQLTGTLPVIGGELVVVTDRSGNVVFAGGETARQVRSAAVRVTSEAAVRTALGATASAEKVPASGLRAGEPRLQAYDPSLLGAPGRPGAVAVWRLEVTSRDGWKPVRELVLVDARTGGVALKFDAVAEATNRFVCDFANAPAEIYPMCYGRDASISRFRREGDPATGVADVDAAYDNAGATADWFRDTAGVDLTALIGSNYPDRVGNALRSSTRICPPVKRLCPFPNAFWDGWQMTYGEGFPQAEDVVAHEMSHGVTEHTSNLFYVFQSGAINESMSDVFGELVDQADGVNAKDSPDLWSIGEDSPLGVVRSMSDPPAYKQPDSLTSPLYAADSIVDDNGGVHTNSGVGNKAAYLIAHGGSFHGATVRGLGLAKTGAIYYRADTLLTSGADYADLGQTLLSACGQLADAGTAGIDQTDCSEVETAVSSVGMLSPPKRCGQPTRPDFDGDSLVDLAVWRPSNGTWYVAGYYGSTRYGTRGDVPVAADYDGDGSSDLALWRPSNGRWYVRGGSITSYGVAGDKPVVADFGCDSKSDLAVWRPSSGTWYIWGAAPLHFGTRGDVPVAADYSGDGRAEVAVWRPANGRWYVSSRASFPYGRSGDKPVVADYNGDGRADVAVWRPATGVWYIRGVGSVRWGQRGDVPVAADYDGDGRADVAIWRPSNGTWYVHRLGTLAWGTSGDVPIRG